MATTLPTGPRGRVVAVGLSLAVLCVAWLAAVAPLLAWHADRAELLEQRRVLVQRMERAAGTLPQLRQTAAGGAASPAPRALLEGASDALAGAALQGQFESLAANAGLSLTSAELLPAEAAGAYRRISLRLVLSGPWPSIVRLLETVDQTSPRMLVDDIQLQVATSVAAGTAQPIAATFTVIAFRSGPQG